MTPALLLLTCAPRAPPSALSVSRLAGYSYTVAHTRKVDIAMSLTHTSTPIHEVALTPVEDYLYWYHGLPTTEEEPTVAIGLHLPAGNPTLDALCDLLGWRSYCVIHQDGIHKPYWHIEEGSLILLAQNLQSKEELRLPARKGIAYGWGPLWDREAADWKRHSSGKPINVCQIKVRAFLHELVRLGYHEPFQLSLRGRVTDSFLQAARAAYRLTKPLSVLRKQERNADEVYLYSVSLPIRAAKERVPVGGNRFIYSLQAHVPTRLTSEYLRLHETPRDLVGLIQGGLLEQTVLWSKHESARIMAPVLPEGVSLAKSADQSTSAAPSSAETARAQANGGTPASVSMDEEEQALDLLFGEAPTAALDPGSMGEQRRRLDSLKEGFALYIPQFSQGSPHWWHDLLAHQFPERFRDGKEVVETGLSEADFARLERLLAQIRQQLPSLPTTRA